MSGKFSVSSVTGHRLYMLRHQENALSLLPPGTLYQKRLGANVGVGLEGFFMQPCQENHVPYSVREAMRKRRALGGSSSVGLIELRCWVSPSVSGDV